MNITLKELSESFAHLGKLAQLPAGDGVTGKQAYWISRIADVAESELTRLEKTRTDLVKLFGAPDKEGNYSVMPDQIEAFSAEIESLLAEVIELPGSQITVKDEQVEKMRLSPLDLMRLRWLIVYDVSEEPEAKTAAASGD